MVKVMDGHFVEESWWKSAKEEEEEEEVFLHYDLLSLVGGKEAACLQPSRRGRVWQDFVLDSLPHKIRKKREKSKTYIEVCQELTGKMLNILLLFIERSQISLSNQEKVSQGIEHLDSPFRQWSSCSNQQTPSNSHVKSSVSHFISL